MAVPSSEGTKPDWPDFAPQSDDDLFDEVDGFHETVETVPLRRGDPSREHSVFQDTLPAGHSYRGTQQRFTQPTQPIRRSPLPATSSSPLSSAVQVAASSPVRTPVPARKQSILGASLMAPAGTYIQRPFVHPQRNPQPITIESDDEGPVYKGGSSDEDRHDRNRSDIKTTKFQKKQADTVPESPARGNSTFQSIIHNSAFGASSNGIKRSSDTMATAYGGASKKPRQTVPSRALPVSKVDQEEDMDVEDIPDVNIRKKIRRMLQTVTQATVRQCYDALRDRKGHYDDALDLALERSEKNTKTKNKPIDLTGSEDELMPTPAAVPRKLAPAPPKPQPPARQQAKVPHKTIAEKWSSTQQVRRPEPQHLHVFDTPLPKKSRGLVRGRKHRSSPVPAPETEGSSSRIGRQVIMEDDTDEDDSGIHSAVEDKTFGNRLLQFFNECTVADLTDTAIIKKEYAEHIVAQRPFRSMNVVEKIQAPDLKPTKNRRTAMPLGEKVADKVAEMLTSYEAVDQLVRQCDNLAQPLAVEIKSWGMKMNKSEKGELDMASFHESQRRGHDSGIGTPVSDDETKTTMPKNFFKQPSIMSMEYTMKDYQVVGMNWLNLLYQRRLSCILADDMGLGKTYQVIAFFAHLFETGEKGPHLVVVPAATLENWLQEFRRFCPRLQVEAYYATHPGGREELRMMLEDNRDQVNVVVTTYQLAKAKEDFPWLREFGFKCTVFDEGHVLKNADSQVSKKLNRIKSKWRLLLTGTPLQNNLRELISLLAFMMPDLFTDKQDELQAIFTHSVKALDENQEALLSAQRIARARSMLTPFILRRKKHQVLKDLPKKDRRVEYCDLTPEQAEIYHTYLHKALDIRERRDRGEEVGNESTHILMKLRQAAIHPFLFRRLYKDAQLPQIAKQCLRDEQWAESNPNLIVTELTAYSDMEIHNLCDGRPALQKFIINDDEWLASGKVQKMLELLRTYIAQGHRTLIFSQFVMVLDILELVLERAGINFFRLDGSTKVSERQDLIDEFSADDNDTPVFMLSTRAGGAGINLAKANKVIVFDSGFNPQDDIQAENRAHRIGQEKDVEVVRLVSRGTVEEQIYKMGLTKLRLDEEVAGVGDEVDVEGEGGKKRGGEEVETEREMEGRKMVEEMFFKKLEESPEEVLGEAKSPVKEKERGVKREQSESGESQKTVTRDLEGCDIGTVNADPGTDAVKNENGEKIKEEPASTPKRSSQKIKAEPASPPKRSTRDASLNNESGSQSRSQRLESRRKSPRKGR